MTQVISIHFNQKGNITFYALVVTPIMFGLLSLILDVSHWQYQRVLAQREVDRLAFEAGRLLPDVSRIKQIQEREPGVSIEVLASGEVRSSVRLSSQLFFSEIFEYFGMPAVSLPIDAEAKVVPVPLDVVLVFSDGSNLRPHAGDQPWGLEDAWPASEYFFFATPPRISISPPPTPPRAWAKWWDPTVFNNARFQRWATQRCFNQIYSPIKETGVLISDFVLSQQINRLGVYTSPGDNGTFTVLRNVYEDSASGIWSTYFEPDSGHSDEGCLYLGVASQRYKIQSPLKLQRHLNTCEPLDGPEYYEEFYPSPLNSKLNDCYKDQVPVRELIYYHGVRTFEANSNQFSDALESAASSLHFSIPDTESDGGLAEKRKKILIIVSDIAVATSTFENKLFDNIDLAFFVYNHSRQNASFLSTAEGLISYLNNKEGTYGELVNESSLLNAVREYIKTKQELVLAS